jgi:hypothetical protein
MNTMKHFQLLSLAGLLALAPMQGALAQGPSLLKPVAASKLAVNGVSLNGHNLNGRKAGGAARSARRADGRGGAGMTVVSIELPGGAHHAK